MPKSARGESMTRSFIFITEEGFTYQPKSVSQMPDVDNFQVLGFSQGQTEGKAFKNFLCENEWLGIMTFRKVSCYELKDRTCKEFLIPNSRVKKSP